jgi:TP901 family phage tail tape measure protein
MAEKGLTVRLKTDNSGFKKGMDEVIAELEKYNKALVDNQYKQRECNKVISNAQKEIKELHKAEKEKGQLDENQKKRLQELTNTIEEEKVKLSQLRTEQASLRNVISQTTQSLTDNNDKWTVLKGTLANLASDTIKKLASSLANIARDVVQTGEQFSASMSEVGAISGATAEELSELEQTARLYGSTTKFSATEAADALKYMALAGWNSQQAIAGLPAVLDLAAASGMDLGRASDIVTDYITAFGLAAEDSARFVDIMSYAMSHSNTTTEMLGEAYKNCAATAKSMGFSVEETTSALMTMANAGVKGGEAGTTLNTLMTRLATNTKGCADELSKYGVEIYDSQGKMHSLSEIMSGLISAFQSLNQQQQANLSKMIAGTNQYSGFQTLMQGMSESAKAAGMSFEDYTAALKECDGASSDMAKTMSNNLTGDLKTLQSALDELKLKLFDSAETPLRNIVKTITEKGVPALETLINHLDIIIPVVVSAAAAMASYKATLAITSIINGVKSGLAQLTAAEVAETAATEGATAAHTGLNTVMAANPIGLLVGAIGGLISLLVTYSLTADKAKKANDELNQSLNSLNSAKEMAENRISTAEGEAELINVLGKRYDELRTKVDKTKTDYQELTLISEQLAEKLDISTDEIRTQTGEYKDLSKEIKNATQQMIEQAKIKALGDLITEATKARYQAQEAYNKQLKKLIDEGIYYYDESGKVQIDNSKITTKELQNEAAELYNLSQIYREADEIVENYSAELEELNKKIAGNKAKSEDDGKAVDETSSKIETVTKKTETLSEKYKRLNGLLEENQKAIKSVNYEIEQAMDSGDAEHLKELQDKLKDLNSENTTLQSRIKAVKDEIEKDANAIADAIENVENSMQMLQKAEKEVTDNGNLSLNTLNSIQKKYPELIGLVNDYVSGVKTEKDVIAGLKEVYEKDVENYNMALAVKKLKQNGFTEDIAKSVVDLVNELKDDYGIDVQNFANANEVKKAALESLKAKAEETQRVFNDFWAENNFDIDMTNGSMNYIAKDPITNEWRSATQQEINRYKAILAARDKAFDNYYTFDTQGVQNYMDLYKLVSADSLLKLGGSETSGGSSNGSGNNNQDTVTLSGYDVTATGNTYAKAYMTWVDRLKSLGKITESGEIYYLEKLKERTDNTAEEIYQIDLKLYNARKKLAEDNAKNLADIEKKNQDELQEKLNMAKAAYDRLVNGKVESLQKEAQAAKDTADAEIAALDKVLQKRKQARAEEDRQKKIDFINAQLRYKQLDEFSRRELQRQKQDLLTEQADAIFEQNISAKKDSINSRLELAQNKSQQAINGLNSAKSQFADHIAYLSGNQTYDQRVANNTTNQNVQIIQNGLNGDQVVAKLLKALGAV